MKRPLLFSVRSVGAGLLCYGLLHAPLALAQPAPPLPPIPPPPAEELRNTASGYNTLLLQQVNYWEASANSLWKQLQQMTKERDEALAKLKEHETPKEAAKETK